MRRVRANDSVQVICGDDRGKVGKVLRIIPDKNQVVVEGVNVVFKHLKRSAKHPQGGRIEREAPLDISNVMPVCEKCGKPARVSIKVGDDGVKNRVCRKCGTPMAGDRK